MSKIYKSFEEWFKYFSESHGYVELNASYTAKMVWNARQAEVDYWKRVLFERLMEDMPNEDFAISIFREYEKNARGESC